MTDFEERVSRALSEGADRAPDGAGLAERARRRARVRRRRVVAAGAVATVVAVLVPVGVLTSLDDPGRQDAPVDGRSEDGPRVGCGDGLDWPVAAMDGGVPGLLEDEPVRDAFASLADEMGIDAPAAIQREGADRVPWIALAVEDSTYAVGVGPWSAAEGPMRGASIVRLDQADDGSLDASSWGDCQLEVALPAGRTPVALKAPEGGVDPTTSDPTVLASEHACTSGRDPSPFLGEPVIVEEADRVVVSLSSEAIEGNVTCPSNPSVPVTLDLAEPLGDRELLDGSVWPPLPLRVASSEWDTVAIDGLEIDVPSEWERRDDCPDGIRYGPSMADGADPCRGGVWLDDNGGPSLEYREPFLLDETSGLVAVADRRVAIAEDDEYEVVRRVLASVRPEGSASLDLSSWTTRTVAPEVTVEVPDGVDVGVTVTPCGSGSGMSGGGTQPDGTSEASVCQYGQRVTAVAPSVALAEVVAATVLFPPEQRTYLEGWKRLGVNDVAFDVPEDWVQLDDTDCRSGAILVYGPPGAAPCSTPSMVVRGAGSLDTIARPGVISGGDLSNGYVLTDGLAVSVVIQDLEVARRVLASVRPATEPAPDLETWTPLDLWDAVSAEVPGDDRVEVVVGGLVSCAAEVAPAQRRPDGRWSAARCGDRLVTVLAPTRALADVIASTVRGY